MRTRLILCGILVAGATLAAHWFKAEKIQGDPLGFFSSRKPVACWQASKPEGRLSGPASSVCAWSDIQSVQILHTLLHIRGPADVEAYIKAVLSDAEFLKAVPEGITLRADEQDAHLSLQAFLKLKDGTYALLSVTDRWAVVEHHRKLGLILWGRPKP